MISLFLLSHSPSKISHSHAYCSLNPFYYEHECIGIGFELVFDTERFNSPIYRPPRQEGNQFKMLILGVLMGAI